MFYLTMHLTHFYHSSDIELFFTDYKADLNLKLQSVLADCQCPTIINLVKALGVVYYKITGPLWEMLLGGVQYLDQYKYIQEMLHSGNDSGPMMPHRCCQKLNRAFLNNLVSPRTRFLQNCLMRLTCKARVFWKT